MATPRRLPIPRSYDEADDADLLASVLGEDGPTLGALRIARRVLARFPSLEAIRRAPVEVLASEAEVPLSRAARVVAALELGRRGIVRPYEPGERLDSPLRAAERFRERLWDATHEHFYAIVLDARLGVIGEALVAQGGLSEVHVRPREAFRPVLDRNGCAVLFVHNHPTGDPEPSVEDIALTGRLVLAGEILGIRVVDHVVVARGGFVSLRERGQIEGRAGDAVFAA